jgi:hypothetical protein
MNWHQHIQQRRPTMGTTWAETVEVGDPVDDGEPCPLCALGLPVQIPWDTELPAELR